MTGYNPPTTDAWEIIRRRREADALATKEALRVGGTQPFQTTRKTKENIERLNAQQADLAALVRAIPVTRIQQAVGGNFTPPEQWQTVASLTMDRPDEKLSSVAWAVGTVDFTFGSDPSGGIVFAAPRVRLVINGNVGVDSGVRGNYEISDTRLNINYAGIAQHVHNPSGSGELTVELQVWANWPPGDRGNYQWSGGSSQIVLNATFTP